MAPRPIRASSVISACCFRLDERKGSAPRETRIASQRIQMMRRSISIAEASSESVPAGLRAPSLRLMALLTGAGLAGPLQAILPWLGARDFIEVEQHLGADDRERAAVHAVGQVGVERDALLVLEPVVFLEHRPDRFFPDQPAHRRPLVGHLVLAELILDLAPDGGVQQRHLAEVAVVP